MYNNYNSYYNPYWHNKKKYGSGRMYNIYKPYPYPYYTHPPFCKPHYQIPLQDYGSKPFVFNIEEATTRNETFRTALWTGNHLQLTLMSIDVGEDIGLEFHPDVDQFIRIEEGEALILMGKTKDSLDFQRKASGDYAILIPAGTWHNIINIGRTPLKLYSIYAPPEHPYGTVHQTKADAEADKSNHH